MEQHRLHQHLALFPFLVYAEGGGVYFNQFIYLFLFIKDKIFALV